MKSLRELLIILAFSSFIISCGSIKVTNLRYEYFEEVTGDPYFLLDSIRSANHLPIPLDYNCWEDYHYRDNNQNPVSVYVLYSEQGGFIYIFSVTHVYGEDSVLLKYRRE